MLLFGHFCSLILISKSVSILNSASEARLLTQVYSEFNFCVVVYFLTFERTLKPM